jgi:trans-aconitate methyltransferase
VALTLLAILQFFDHEQGYDVVGRLVARLAPGSVLAVSVAPDNPADEEELSDGAAAIRAQGLPQTLRTPEQTARFFDGMDILPPGVVRVSEWHPDHDTPDQGDTSHMYTAVGVKR